jgi:hypothetical protein
MEDVMNCDKVMDTIYEYSGEPMPLLAHLQVTLHLFFCPDCAQEYERFELSREMLRTDFFPLSPDFEGPIMNLLTEEINVLEGQSVPGGLSTRGWVIAGLIILVSLVSAFFGLDFNKVAQTAGISFLLPVGITIGIVLTSYGALFIGSHLKELSERFGL